MISPAGDPSAPRRAAHGPDRAGGVRQRARKLERLPAQVVKFGKLTPTIPVMKVYSIFSLAATLQTKQTAVPLALGLVGRQRVVP